MKITLLNDNILTELQEEEKINGLYIPSDKAYKVLKTIKSEDTTIEEGSLLYVMKNAGTFVEIEGNDYVIVNRRDIILMI